MTRHLTAPLLAAAITLGPALALAADSLRVELTDPSSPAELEVEIEWGSIRVRGATVNGELTIVARADRPDEVAGSLITAGEKGNRVTVTQAPLESGVFRSAHLEIEVPRRTSLQLKVNRGGDVWVEDVEGLFEVTNLNGSVELAGISGAAAVNASNGSIRAAFTRVDLDRDMYFGSLNGSVELCLPPELAARVHLTTAGDPIRSDFAIEQEPTVRTVAPGQTVSVQTSGVRGRIGSGGALLRASTLNGEIYLERCD